jgi:hypothetical protein
MFSYLGRGGGCPVAAPSFSGIRSGINSSLPDHQPLWDKFILASLELFATIVV